MPHIRKIIFMITLALAAPVCAKNVFVVTSFDSFPGVSYNPTQAVVKRLPDYLCTDGVTTCDEENKVYIIKKHLSTTWDVIDKVPMIIEEYNSDDNNLVGIVSLGYDPRMQFSKGLTLEKFASNMTDGTDNDDKTRGDYLDNEQSFPWVKDPVIEDGPSVLKMPNDINLDIVKGRIEQSNTVWNQSDNIMGVDVDRVRVGKLDQDHNLYICNATLYSNLYTTQDTGIFGGFVHIKSPDEIFGEQTFADAIQIYIQYVVDVKIGRIVE